MERTDFAPDPTTRFFGSAFRFASTRQGNSICLNSDGCTAKGSSICSVSVMQPWPQLLAVRFLLGCFVSLVRTSYQLFAPRAENFLKFSEDGLWPFARMGEVAADCACHARFPAVSCATPSGDRPLIHPQISCWTAIARLNRTVLPFSSGVCPPAVILC